MKKRLTINYRKAWGKDGTFYDQHIKINKDFIKYINKQIKHYHNANYENQCIIADTIGFSTYYDCYLTELDEKEKINFITQVQLSFIYYYLSINNYDISRIKRRNTIIEVV